MSDIGAALDGLSPAVVAWRLAWAALLLGLLALALPLFPYSAIVAVVAASWLARPTVFDRFFGRIRQFTVDQYGFALIGASIVATDLLARTGHLVLPRAFLDALVEQSLFASGFAQTRQVVAARAGEAGVDLYLSYIVWINLLVILLFVLAPGTIAKLRWALNKLKSVPLRHQFFALSTLLAAIAVWLIAPLGVGDTEWSYHQKPFYTNLSRLAVMEHHRLAVTNFAFMFVANAYGLVFLSQLCVDQMIGRIRGIGEQGNG